MSQPGGRESKPSSSAMAPIQCPPRTPTAASRQNSSQGLTAAAGGGDTAETAGQLLDEVCASLPKWREMGDAALRAKTLRLNRALKANGRDIEATHAAQLRSLGKLLSDAGKDFDAICRLLLLEVIELRTMDWRSNPNVDSYYKQKLAQYDFKEEETPGSSSVPATPVSSQCNGFQRSVSLNVHAAEYRPLTAVAGSNSNGAAEQQQQQQQRSPPVVLPNRSEKTAAAAKLLGHFLEECRQGKGDPADYGECSYDVNLPANSGKVTLMANSTIIAQTAKMVLEDFFSSLSHEFQKAAASNGNGVVQQPRRNGRVATQPPPATASPSKVVVVRQPLMPEHRFPNNFQDTALESSSNRRVRFSRTVSSRDVAPKEDGDQARTAKEDKNNNEEEDVKPPEVVETKSRPKIHYSREKLLRTAERRGSSTDLPLDWLGDVLLNFPDLRRPDGVDHPLPVDWAGAFRGEVVKNYVQGLSDADFYSVPNNQGLYSTREGINNNNNHHHGGGDGLHDPRKKKNFLEVLRPNAPSRIWDDALGEWVEKSEEAGRA